MQLVVNAIDDGHNDCLLELSGSELTDIVIVIHG
jgi:hypothetical protein